MKLSIHTENLGKVYKLGRKKGTRTAVNNLNIEVPQGVVFGFLGPNGAGKTTTIKMLLNFVRPTSGSATIFGKSITEAATRIPVGYLPEQPYFHKFLKPIEIVSMHARLAGTDKSKVHEQSMKALEHAGIVEYSDTPIAKLSKGLTQRVGIAQAIVGNPQLLILDEPTSGLDPIGRHHTRDLLLQLKNEGKTIFLSSHILSEIENICDSVAILKQGDLVAYGPPDTVRNNESFIVIQTIPLDMETQNRLKFLNVDIKQRSEGTILTLNSEDIYKTMRMMEEMHLPIIRIETRRESLEEAFLRLAA